MYGRTWKANTFKTSCLDIVKGRFLNSGVIPRIFIGSSIETVSQIPPWIDICDEIRGRDGVKGPCTIGTEGPGALKNGCESQKP